VLMVTFFLLSFFCLGSEALASAFACFIAAAVPMVDPCWLLLFRAWSEEDEVENGKHGIIECVEVRVLFGTFTDRCCIVRREKLLTNAALEAAISIVMVSNTFMEM